MGEIILFGASKTGKEIFDFIQNRCNIICFCDNDASKWGGEFFGCNIIPPIELMNYHNVKIIICTYRYNEIIDQLQSLGLTNYCVFTEFIDEFVDEFMNTPQMKGYISTNSNNIILGDYIKFNQKTLFRNLGKVIVGDNVEFGYKHGIHFYGFYQFIESIDIDSVIRIGEKTTFNNDLNIRCKSEISIGKNCLIGDRVTIMDFDAHDINPYKRNDNCGESMPINIGNNVWIGSGCVILKGVSIGNNSVIGAGSMVTKSIPDNCIAVGNPARVKKGIRQLNLKQ